MPLWFTIAIAAGLASNISNFITRQILKDEKDVLTSSFFLEATKIAIFGAATVFDHRINITPKSMLLLASIVASEPIAIYLYMKMHELNHLSVSSIVTRTRMIWTAIFAFAFLGEALKPLNYAGIGILFFGLSIVVAPHRIFVDRGIKIASLFAIETAIFSVMLKAVSQDISLPIIVLCSAIPSTFFFYFLAKRKKHGFGAFLKYKSKPKIMFGISNFAAFWGFIYALTQGPVSIVTAIYQGMIVFGVLAGIIFLNERQNVGRKIVGSAITVIGIILLSVF